MPNRMTAVDAQFYWMAAKLPTDFIHIVAFDGIPTEFDRALDALRTRAQNCRALTLRAVDGSRLTYPRWGTAPIGPDRIVRHEPDADTWDGCLRSAAAWADQPLDPGRTPWRMHVMAPVHAIPGVEAPGTVAVLRFAHALTDGSRAAALTAWLFGHETPVPEIPKACNGFLPRTVYDAVRTYREQLEQTRAGLLSPPIGAQPALATNTPPAGVRSVRTLVRHRSELGGPTATVAALAAVSGALAEHLGDAPASMVAEVTMAKDGIRLAHNHFANVTIGLHPDAEPVDRRRRIAADLDDARRRREHPAVAAADRAFATTPAALLRWGVNQFDTNARPQRVSGNTVVSSIRRLPDDLTFGHAPAVLAAFCPSLAPTMGVVHGIWGAGDSVTVSVHAAESAIGDVDSYIALLDAQL